MSANMPKISKYKMFKGVTSFIAGAGAGSIASSAAKSFIPTDANIVKKVACVVGTFAISGIVGDAASKYTSNYIDDTAAQVHEVKKAWRNEQSKRDAETKNNEKKDEN